MAFPNIFDPDAQPDLDDGDSMTCVYGQRVEGEERVDVVLRQNWTGGDELNIECDDEASAQKIIDAIAENADRAAVHIVFKE